MRNYRRVVPRDLFNEAKLLKCLGKVTLFIVDGIIPGLNMEFGDTWEGFEILQNEDDGSIESGNISFFDNSGRAVEFFNPLNSKGPWPLMMRYRGSEYYFFQDDGSLGISKTLFEES